MKQLESLLEAYAVSSQPELREWCSQVLNEVIALREETYQATGYLINFT